MIEEGRQDAQTDVRQQMVELLPRLRRFCGSISGSADAADDLLQATVTRAMEKIHLWQDQTRLDAWLFRIARNMNIDLARGRKVRGVEIDIDTMTDAMSEDGRTLVEARSSLAAARSAMARLPEDQRALLALVTMEGLSYREAAEVLDIPIGTVMSRLARARRSVDIWVNGETRI